MNFSFCRRCGAPLKPGKANAFHCANGHTIFENPVPTVGIFFVTDDNQVLLAERGIEPNIGELDSFGGFLEKNESVEDAAVRELREELALEPDEYEPLRYLTTAYADYEYENEDHPIIHTMYWTRLKTDRELHPADDVAAIHKLPLNDVDHSQLHADDIRAGLRTLQQLFA